MSDQSHIQWTDATWNVVTGCTKISPGCAHCYIERTPPFRMAGRKFEGGKIPLELHADRLEKPLHWRKPKRIFVNSLSDLFHEDVPDEFIDKVFAVMAMAPQHTFQVLTKRAERMQRYARAFYRAGAVWRAAFDYGHSGALGTEPEDWPLQNVWLGVSVEDQQRADERIPLLLQTPAAVRFLSCEPLLGPVDLGDWDHECGDPPHSPCPVVWPDWVIVGGESGPNSRPCNIAWIRSIVEQCKSAGAACFVKQLGSLPMMRADSLEGRRSGEHPESEWPEGTGFTTLPGHAGTEWQGRWAHLRDKKGGDMAEFPEALRVREFPEQPQGVTR